MGIPEKAKEGIYKYGKGKVFVLRHDPKEYVLEKNGDKKFVEIVEQAYGKLQLKNSFFLERGPYTLVAVLDEGVVSDKPFTKKSDFIDLFSPELAYLSEVRVQPGTQAYLFNLRRIDRKRPQVIAAASRQYEAQETKDGFSFVSKSPLNTTNIICLSLPKDYAEAQVSCTDAEGRPIEYTMRTLETRGTPHALTLLWLSFENSPDGIKVQIKKQ